MFFGWQITGHGLALAGAGIEQEAGYWEWHIIKVPEGTKIQFGVSHKKNRDFYNELEKSNESESWNKILGTRLFGGEFLK